MNYTKDCTQFLGSIPVVGNSNNQNIVSLFYNPCCSNVSISLESITFVNLSGNPVRIDVFAQPEICGELCKSEDIVPKDLGCLNKVASSVEICYGTNIKLLDGYRIATITMLPYTTNPAPIRIPVTLPPGTARGFIFTSIGELDSISISTIYDWSEN